MLAREWCFSKLLCPRWFLVSAIDIVLPIEMMPLGLEGRGVSEGELQKKPQTKSASYPQKISVCSSFTLVLNGDKFDLKKMHL